MTRARYLRKNATDCERILWRHLRNRKFADYKFRRQHAIDPYVLDFYCPALKLAIELDGSGHDSRLREKRDKKREKFLIAQGIAVIRFWNHQIREELDSVLETIWLALEQRASSNPSP
jgi:very-short-patch-repair endonuclease